MSSFYTYIDEAVLCIKREEMQLQLTIKFQLITVFKSQRVFITGKFLKFIHNEVKFWFLISKSLDLDQGQVFIFDENSALVIFKEDFWNPDPVACHFGQDVWVIFEIDETQPPIVPIKFST